MAKGGQLELEKVSPRSYLCFVCVLYVTLSMRISVHNKSPEESLDWTRGGVSATNLAIEVMVLRLQVSRSV